MAQYSRLKVYNTISESGLMPIFNHKDAATARKILDACVSGAAKLIEFTNRGDGAWHVFTDLLEYRQQSPSTVMLGAGSIVDAATAAIYVNNGADFIVGPTFVSEIAELCNRRKVAYIPGCGTLTEISNAERAGVEMVKIFPANVLGPEFIKAVHGPQPWTSMVITGGVLPDETNIKTWFEAGATAVGMGTQLIRPDWVEAGQYQLIAATVSQVLGWIGRIRSQQREKGRITEDNVDSSG